MARVRVPFAWERAADPLDTAPAVDWLRLLSVPEAPVSVAADGPVSVSSVEAPVGDLRRGRDGLERRLREAGVDSDTARAAAIQAVQDLARRKR